MLMILAVAWSWLLARRVFIAWINPIFCESVRLLLNHPEIEIVGDSAESDKVKQIITELQPETVIVEESGNEIPFQVLSFLEKYHWLKRIIGFSLDDNRVNVYHREERNVVQASELLQLVQME